MLRAFEFALCSSCSAVPNVVYYTFQFHSTTFAATAYDHIRMYILAHTYVYPFQCDLTCTDIFRIISWSRHINLMQFMDTYYLYLVVFLLLCHMVFCTTYIWSYYLHSAVPCLATYASTYSICLVVLLIRGQICPYYLHLNILRTSSCTTYMFYL